MFASCWAENWGSSGYEASRILPIMAVGTLCILPPDEEGAGEEGAEDAAVALVAMLAAEVWEEGCGAASERS